MSGGGGELARRREFTATDAVRWQFVAAFYSVLLALMIVAVVGSSVGGLVVCLVAGLLGLGLVLNTELAGSHPYAAFRRRLPRQLARWLRQRPGRPVSLCEVVRQPPGSYLRVRGRGRSRERLVASALGAGSGVCRILLLSWRSKHLVDEAGEDFDLVDELGVVRVRVDGAVIAAVPKLRRLDPREAGSAIALIGEPRGRIDGGEIVVRDGDEIEVFGVRDIVVDPTVEERLPRDTPLRPALRSAPGRPLQILPRRR